MMHPRIALFTLLWPLAACALAQTPDVSRLIAQGDSLLGADKVSKAMGKYNAAVELNPTADALAARAKGWLYQGRTREFLQDVTGAMTLDSLHPQANYQRALYAFRTGDHTAAVRYATQALVRPDKPNLRQRALIVRGQAEAAAGRRKEAITDLQAGTKDRMDEPEAMKLLARLLNEDGKPEASLEILEMLCAAHPEDIGNWSNKGFELNQLERYKEAIEALEHALAIDKDEPVVLSNKAFALMHLNRDKEALATVNKSLRADALNPYALRTRAMLYLRKGERDKACNDLLLSKVMGSLPDVEEMIKQHCGGMDR